MVEQDPIEPPVLGSAVSLDDIRREPQKRRLEPDADTMSAIAAYSGVEKIDAWAADITATALTGRRFEVTGQIAASYDQTCVVSLQPISRDVVIAIERVFQMPPEPRQAGEEYPFSEEPPDPIKGEGLGLGQIALEEFVLSLDPHPKREGAKVPDYRDSGTSDESRPFAALARLRDKDY